MIAGRYSLCSLGQSLALQLATDDCRLTVD